MLGRSSGNHDWLLANASACVSCGFRLRNGTHATQSIAFEWNRALTSCAGNDDIHLLTLGVRQQLRVDLRDWEGNRRYAEYDNFKVGSEQQKYKLHSMGNYHGNAGR